MGTTARSSPTTGARRRASARSHDDEPPRDEFDLLTAALLGAAVGAGMTLLFRRGPRGSRPIGPIMHAAGTGARHAGVYGLKGARWAGGQAVRGAEWARDRGEDLWDRVPREEIADRMEDYLETARDTIDEVVSREVSDLRKAIRRQRKKIGI